MLGKKNTLINLPYDSGKSLILCLQSHVANRSSDLPHILRTSMLIHSYQLSTKYCAEQSESQTEFYRENFSVFMNLFILSFMIMTELHLRICSQYACFQA